MLVNLPYKVLPITVSRDKTEELRDSFSESGMQSSNALIIECNKDDDYVMGVLNELVPAAVKAADKAGCSHLQFQYE